MIYDDILSSIGQILRNKYKGVYLYKEGEILNYPSFYISYVNIISEDTGLGDSGYYTSHVFIRLEYRASEEPLQDSSLISKLNKVGFELIELLKSIKVKNVVYKPKITLNEIIDGVKIIEFNFLLSLNNYKPTPYDKMQKLYIKNKNNIER